MAPVEKKLVAGEKLEIVKRRTPFVELPLGATEDRVTGTIDIERALKEAGKAFEPGILARVNRGILYIDEVTSWRPAAAALRAAVLLRLYSNLFIEAELFEEYVERAWDLWHGCREEAGAREAHLEEGMELFLTTLKEAIAAEVPVKANELFLIFYSPHVWRRPHESMQQYIIRREQDFKRLEDHAPGTQVSDNLRSMMLLIFGGLDHREQLSVLSSVNNEYDFKKIAHAMRIQFPSIAGKPVHRRDYLGAGRQAPAAHGHQAPRFRWKPTRGKQVLSVTEEPDEDFENIDEGDEAYYEESQDTFEVTDQDYSYSEDEGLDTLMAEMFPDNDFEDADAAEVLATIAQMRMKGKGKGKGRSKGSGKSTSSPTGPSGIPFRASGEMTFDQKAKEQRRSAVKFPKTITPCTSCGQKGHWQGDQNLFVLHEMDEQFEGDDVYMVLKDYGGLCEHSICAGGLEKKFHRGANGHARYITCKEPECNRNVLNVNRREPAQLWRSREQFNRMTNVKLLALEDKPPEKQKTARIMRPTGQQCWLYGVHLVPGSPPPDFPLLSPEDMDVLQPLPGDATHIVGGPYHGYAYIQVAESPDCNQYCAYIIKRALDNEPMTPDTFRFAFYLYGRIILVYNSGMKRLGGPMLQCQQVHPAMDVDRLIKAPIQMNPDDHQPQVQECEVMMANSSDSDPEVMVAMADPPGLAILDSGCSRTMHGRGWAAEFEKALTDLGLTFDTKAKDQSFKGIGGHIKSTEIKIYPIGIGGRHGQLHTAETPDMSPLLLSRPFMKKLGTTMDVEHETVSFTQLGLEDIPMIRTSRGHLAINLLEFDMDNLDMFHIEEALVSSPTEPPTSPEDDHFADLPYTTTVEDIAYGKVYDDPHDFEAFTQDEPGVTKKNKKIAAQELALDGDDWSRQQTLQNDHLTRKPRKPPYGKTWLKQIFAGQMGLTLLAVALGMMVGAPLDSSSSAWDAGTSMGAKQLAQDLKVEDPYVLAALPAETVTALREEGRKVLRLVAKAVVWRLQAKRHVFIEQPLRSQSLDEPEMKPVKDYVDSGQLIYIKVDGGMMGYKDAVSGYPHKKPSYYLTDMITAQSIFAHAVCLTPNQVEFRSEGQADELRPVLSMTESERRKCWLQIDPDLRKTLRDLHVNFGHPTNVTLQRILRRQKARPEAIKAVDYMPCDACGDSVRKKRPKPVRLPSAYKFNHHILVDVFHAYDIMNNQYGFLNMIDDGTRLSPVLVNRKEFLADFSDYLKQYGVEVEAMPLESPWKNGKVEKAGGLWKNIFAKTVSEMQITGLQGIQTATSIVTQVRNDFPRENGYSPNQWVLGGHEIRVPGSLLSDYESQRLEVLKAADNPQSAMAKNPNIREAARVARTDPTGQTGDRSQRWHGPARVIGIEPRNPHRLEDPEEMTDGAAPHSYWLRYGSSVVLTSGEQMSFANEDLAAHMVPQEIQTEESIRGTGCPIPVTGLRDYRLTLDGDGDQGEIHDDWRVPHYQQRIHYLPLVHLRTNNHQSHEHYHQTLMVSMSLNLPQPRQYHRRLRENYYTQSGTPTVWMVFLEQSALSVIALQFLVLTSSRMRTGSSDGSSTAEEDNQDQNIPTNFRMEEAMLTGKAVRSETNLKDLDPEDRALYDVSMGDEWQSWIKFEAVDILTEKQKEDLDPDIKVVGTRWVHTDKNRKARLLALRAARKTGKSRSQIKKEFPIKAKSRFVVQGCQEINIGIRSDSPTASLLAFNLVCAVAVIQKWFVLAADASTAYLQSQGIDRVLILRPPRPPPPGVSPHDLMRARGSIYGTKDAGRAWWKKLIRSLSAQGWRRSRIESALLFLYVEDSFQGIMITHVDDLFAAGEGKAYDESLRVLEKELHLTIKRGNFRFCGKDLVQHPDYKIELIQKEAIGTIEYQVLDKRRRIVPNSPLSKEEISQFRALIGSMGWVTRQTRPDLMVNVSMASQSMSRPRVRDVIELNKALKMLKDTADAKMCFCPNDQLTLSDTIVFVCADSSHANAETKAGEKVKSQCGYVVGLAHKDLATDKEVPVLLLEAQSSTIKRVCRSTLAAESNAFLMGAEAADYVRSLLMEMLHPDEKLINLESEYVKRMLLVLTDAKSLESTIVKDAGQPTEKRVKMLADVLTKVGCERELMLSVLDQGIWGVTPSLLATAKKCNLLDDQLVDVLLDSAAGGINTVEREGVSVRHPARFVLIGTSHPDEGDLRPQLLDRFGLTCSIRTALAAERRMQVLSRAYEWNQTPEKIEAQWASTDEAFKKLVVDSRERLKGVKMPHKLALQVSTVCSKLNVDGLRGDIVTNRAARALAALERRSEVTEEDVRRVAPLCLQHRLRKDVVSDTLDNTARVVKVLLQEFGEGPPPIRPVMKFLEPTPA
ncbi:unnamed protein product [Effrenium voratum]|uniref:magnesium chelatase n=1 Tax=Effrenium voratum TaxID=2562239 RepID=A0AA36JTB3_9DINO|nr:unnamed protein product [Effrenium voratum]